MGKSSGGASGASQMAEMLSFKNYKKAKPLQNEVYSGLSDFMNGGRDVSANPVWGAGKYAAEKAYGSSNDQIMNSMPAGGALYSAAAGNAANRASTLTQLMGQIAQDDYNKAYGIATGDPQTSVSNLQQLGQSQDAQNASDAASNNQATGQAASSAASIASMIAMIALAA